jgi:hypothetical protein
MKTKVVLLSICLFFTCNLFAQSKLFEKYANMENVTSVYISKTMFQLISDLSGTTKKVNFSDIKDKIESLQILTSEHKDKVNQMKKEFTQMATTQYKELMKVVDGEDRIMFYAHFQGEKIKELVLLIEDKESFTVILLVCNLNLQDIKKLIK